MLSRAMLCFYPEYKVCVPNELMTRGVKQCCYTECHYDVCCNAEFEQKLILGRKNKI
jgi:hypothetical protein